MATPRKYRICNYCGETYWPKSPRRSRRFCSYSCARRGIGTPKGMVNAGSFGNGRPAWNKGLLGFRSGEKRPETGAAIRTGQLQRPGIRITSVNYRIRRSVQYAAWRTAVFERDNYTCQICGARSAIDQRIQLHADHILPFASYPEKRLDIMNGRTLCSSCHRQTPTYARNLGQKAVQLNA